MARGARWVGAAAVGSSLARFSWYRFRTTLRSRLGGYLAITLVLGLIGGVAIGALVGARRTQSAYPASLVRSNASDLQFSAYIGGCRNFLECLYSPKFTRQIAALPHVQRVAATPEMFLAPIARNGRPYLPYAFANNLVDTVGTIGGEYFSMDRLIADHGQVPNPADPDEFAVTADAARSLHWHVGEVIPMAGYSIEQVFSLTGSGLPKHPVARFKLRLTGIVAFDTSVVHDQVDRYPTYAIFTPALTRTMVAKKGGFFSTYELKLDDGSKYVADVERGLIGLLPRGSSYQFHVTSVDEGVVERATKPESIALGAFGIIAALAALLIAGQAIGRTIRRSRRDLDVLRACGADPSMIAADSLLGVFGAILVGALCAAVIGLALTPLTPIAAVRQVDPSPGVDFDWMVIAGGFGIAVVVLSAFAIVYALASLRTESLLAVVATTEGSSRIVETASRTGLPPAAVAGVRFAVVRAPGRDAVPIGSAFIGAALAVLVLVTTVTFASGLSTLVSHPALYGWNWNYAIEEAGNGGKVPAHLSDRLLSSDKYVASWQGFSFANYQVDGVTVPGMITTTHAAISPPIVSGHAIDGVDQIVLGGATLAELHKRVGDWVTATYGDKKDAPLYVPPRRLRIVGVATFPAIGDSGSLHPSMGEGALVSGAIAPPALNRANQNPDQLQDGKAIVVIRLRAGAPKGPAYASLARLTNKITRAIQADPQSGGGTFELLSVQQPAEIVNYKTIGATPAVLAVGLAVAAAFALGLTLAASVRRRRRDLALLKSFGFVRRQLLAVVLWQASIAAFVGVLIGVPLGILSGRSLWSLFAREIYAVPRSTVPTLQIVYVALGAIILANLVAFLPGRTAARTRIAALLRAE
jgi:hypothetical protein